MPSPATFPLFDQLLNGRLEQILRRYRDQGMGARKIADRLRDDHGITPSYRTVGRWLADLEEAA